MADYVAPKHEKISYSDLELTLVNKGYVISFFHIPTARSVYFKGMITEFSDKYESNWNSEDVYGRSDPIQSFRGTKRVISLSWDVVAASVEESKKNMETISLLLAMLYPSYSEGTATSITSSPLFKLSFANLIQNVAVLEQNTQKGGVSNVADKSTQASAAGSGVNNGLVGTMGGLTYSPKLEEGLFDIEVGVLYPKSLNLSCEFTVLHTHNLGWNVDKTPRSGFSKFPYGMKLPVDSEENVKKISQTKGTLNQEKANKNKMTKKTS